MNQIPQFTEIFLLKILLHRWSASAIFTLCCPSYYALMMCSNLPAMGGLAGCLMVWVSSFPKDNFIIINSLCKAWVPHSLLSGLGGQLQQFFLPPSRQSAVGKEVGQSREKTEPLHTVGEKGTETAWATGLSAPCLPRSSERSVFFLSFPYWKACSERKMEGSPFCGSSDSRPFPRAWEDSQGEVVFLIQGWKSRRQPFLTSIQCRMEGPRNRPGTWGGRAAAGRKWAGKLGDVKRASYIPFWVCWERHVPGRFQGSLRRHGTW